MRVLVVEDDPGVRAVVSRFLRRQGCLVREAADAAQGLAAVAQEDFDAVVCDVHLPAQSGPQFRHRALRVRPELRGRFVFCSAVASPSAPPSGDELFLRKPFDLLALWDAVRSRVPQT